MMLERYLDWVRRTCEIDLPDFRRQAHAHEGGAIYIARHRDIAFLPILSPHLDNVLVIAANSQGGMRLRRYCREARISFTDNAGAGACSRAIEKVRTASDTRNKVIRALRAGQTIIASAEHDREAHLNRGPLVIARRTGCQIVPFSITSSRSIRLPTWDRMRLPLPYSKIGIALHPAITVSRNASRAKLIEIANQLRAVLGFNAA